VFEFNELEYYSPIPGSPTGEHRFNFWGYSTVNFFSPMARYSFAIASGADGAALQQEFKLLVREAHKRGIEVRVGVIPFQILEAGFKSSLLLLHCIAYSLSSCTHTYIEYVCCGFVT
jgi:pullulanase/glycogen debranching enzyme